MSDSDWRLVQMQRQIDELHAVLDELKTRERDNGWGAVIGRHLALPNLRGFWPMSSSDQNGVAFDMSEQGRSLSWTSTASGGTYNSRVAYFDFNGSTSFIGRADEAGLDITSSLTFGGWFWHDTATASQTLMAKWNPTGNQRAYGLQMLDSAPDVWRVFVSNLGSDTVVLPHTAAVSTGAWHHVIGRFTPSTELSIFVDGVEVSTAAGVPASIFNSTAELRIGALGDSTQLLDGRATLCFLCAGALPDTLLQELYAASRRFFV